jgi:peroxiredoxin
MEKQSNGAGVLLLAAIVFGGVYLTSDRSLGKPAPSFSLPETYGGRVDLESYRGRPVLLAFWMLSCGPCLDELPMLDRLSPEFHRKGIEVLAIHLGEGDPRDFLRSNHIELTSLVDTEGVAARAYNVSAVPRLVLIGSDGKVQRTAASADESLLREWMESAQ